MLLRKKLASGLMVTLFLMGTLTLAFSIHRAKASGTIYIRADGSIDPPTAPISSVDNVTYILTGNIASDADGIVIERDNITLFGAGYTVQGTSTQSEGILLSGRSNVTVKNTEVTEFDIGLSLIGSNNNTISENTITANNGFGIGLNHSSSNSVSSNNIPENGYGIWVYLGFSNSISDNNFTANNWYGIGLIDSSSNVISGNNIINTQDRGITVGSGSNNSISGNSIANNQVGIDLSWCYFSCNIYENTIANNWESIRSVYSSNNSIYHNNFIGNIRIIGGYRSGANTWDDGYPSGGNYWSDYTGADANSDGICDTSYSINEIEQDHYPLMSPWGKIPELPSPRFWAPQWLFYTIVAAIVAVVIAALVGAVYFLKKRKLPTPNAPTLLEE
jgi:parallel beta-helix repeat protein